MVTRKLKVEFKGTIDRDVRIKKKVEILNEVLGNDLDKEIILAINKKNNKLKRFARQEGLLQYQLALFHFPNNYNELFYEYILDRTYIDMSDSNLLFEVCFEKGYAEYNKITKEEIFTVEILLRLFGEQLSSLYTGVKFSLVDEEVENPKTPRILELEREVVTRCLLDLDKIDTEVSLPNFLDITEAEIEYILQYAKKVFNVVYNIDELDLEVIHLCKYLGKEEDEEEEEKSVLGESTNINTNVQKTGIRIVFDDIEEDYIHEFAVDSDKYSVYYISELDNTNNQEIHKI